MKKEQQVNEYYTDLRAPNNPKTKIKKKKTKKKNGITSKVKKVVNLASNLTLPGQLVTAGKGIVQAIKKGNAKGKVKKKKKMDAYRANVRDRAKTKG